MLSARKHATLKGRVEWEILDRNGEPSFVLDQYGRRIEGGRQPNLITDDGMDAIAIRNLFGQGDTALRYRFAVGTGSTEPDVTDVVLDAEVQNTIVSEAGAPASTNVADVDDYLATLYTRHLLTLNADRNLTEFGYKDDAGDLVIRELFRDDLGDPITLSLLDGKQVRMTHELEYRVVDAFDRSVRAAVMSWDEYDAANVLVSSTPLDASAFYVVRTLGLTTGLTYLQPNHPTLQLTGSNQGYFWGLNATGKANLLGGGAPASADGTGVSTASGVGNIAAASYIGGSYERAVYANLEAATLASAGWYGFAYGKGTGTLSTSWTAGFAIVLDDPATIEKLNTHTLRLGHVLSWARAGS